MNVRESNSRLIVVSRYTDFEIGSNAIFYKAQYNWDNDGYALVHQVLDGLAPLLGAELQHIQTLTYNQFANVEGKIDTSAFREAVWHYTHRIKGLLDDDYNYAEVNQVHLL
jgi:sestrin